METNLAQSVTTNSISLPFNEVLPALSNKTLFWRPKFLADDQGLSHLPFLFWVTESIRPAVTVQLGFGNGSSYFALCQAVDKLDIDGRCYAVDPDMKTEHDYNRSQYEEFSRLLALPYTQANQNFQPKTVDLLHINLKADHLGFAQLLSQWLPLLSDSGVLLLQNSNSVSPQSWALMVQQLKKQYSVFELLHDNGLLVVAPAEILSESFARLLSFTPHSKAFELVQTVFSRLGKACSEVVRADNALAKAQQVQVQLLEQEEALEHSQLKINELLKSLSEHKTWLSNRNDEFSALDNQLKLSVESAELQKFQAEKRIAFLEQLRTELKQEIETLFNHVDTLRSEQEANNSLVEKWQQDVQALSSENAQLTKSLNEAKTLLDTSTEKQSELAQQLRNALADVEKLNTITRKQHFENTQLNQQLSEANALLENNQQVSINSETTLKQQAAQHQQQLQALQRVLTEQKQKDIAVQLELNQKLEQQSQALALEKKHRFDETATLTNLLNQTQSQLRDVQQHAKVSAADFKQAQQQSELSKQQLHQYKQDIKRLESNMKVQQRLLLQVQAERNKLNQSVVLADEKAAVLAKLAKFSLLKPFVAISQRFSGLTLKHKIEKQRQQILASGLFDENYYKQQYPDVANSTIDLIEHYLKFGAYEGRNPSANFNSLFYLNTYADVRTSGVNPLWHFIAYGQKEQRKPLSTEQGER